MSTRNTYHINPTVAWINEANGNCVLVIPKNYRGIQIGGLEAILWRSIWQGLSFDVWEQTFEETDKNLNNILRDWLAAGWIIKADD